MVAIMSDKDFNNIPLKDYPNLSDETLYEIMEFFGQTYNNAEPGSVWVQYRYAFEIIQLRHNKRLVDETARLADKTLKIAKWTMLVAIATVVVALGTIGTLWITSLPKCP
jgi:hypothetical protein